MDTRNPQIIVNTLWCPKLSPLGSPVPDYNRCIQLIDRIKNTNKLKKKRSSHLKSWHSGPKLQALRATSCNRDDKHQVDDRQHAPNNLMNYYMIELIQSLPSPLYTAGKYSHMRR